MASEEMKNKRKSLSAPAITFEDDEKQTVWQKAMEKFQHFYANEATKLHFMVVWTAANLIYFFYTFQFYHNSKAFKILGYGVTTARGSGAVLKLNCSMILIPVCRKLMLWARETWLNNWLFPVDKAIAFHKKVGWTIAAFSYIHTVCHLYNVYHLSNVQGSTISPYLNKCPVPQNGSWTEVDWLFKSIPGFTGIIICLAMFFMYATANKPVRSLYFEAFWYTHHLFIIFFIMLLAHGAQALLQPPSYWQWFIGPAVLYAYERWTRFSRGEVTTIIVDAIAHKSKVMELRFHKEGFQYKVGQYLFLNVPELSENEWHPFTISSCPSDAYVSCHIRQAGDWTTAAATLFLKSEHREEILTTSSLKGRPVLRVDGPFGSAADKCMTDYGIVVLVAAGVGVTPFASILKEIRVRYLSGVDFPLRKVYFIWTSRDKEAFEWFSDLLAEFEAGDLNGLLSINVYLTGALKTDDIRKIVYSDDDGKDAITGLQAGTQFGRPNFNAIVKELSEVHVGEKIGVFLCGPKVLANQIRRECRRFTVAGSTTFVFNKENF